MTAYNGVQCTAIAAGSNPPVTQVGGRVRCFHETFTYAAQASGSTITVAKLPVGAQILSMVLTTDTSTASCTLEVGDGTTAAKYVALAAYTSANTPTLLPLKVASVTSSGAAAPLTADGSIVITTAVVSLPSSGTLVFDTYYTVD